MKDLVTLIEVDMGEGVDEVEHPSDGNIETGAAQEPAEDDEIFDESTRRV